MLGRTRGSVRLPSPWMVARQERCSRINAGWVVVTAGSAVAGLLDAWWLWLIAAIVCVRGVTVAVVWLRLQVLRWHTRRTGRIIVPAAARRDRARQTRNAGSWALQEALIGGCLEVCRDGWVWRPNMLSRSEFDNLHLPRTVVDTVTTCPRQGYGRPRADYVQLITTCGSRVDLLIWDYTRIPRIRPRSTP